MSKEKNRFGTQLKQWRTSRNMSQMLLAQKTGISTRHLSFLETGRSNPSREMVQYLCEALSLPLRARNGLYKDGGYAEPFPHLGLEGSDMSGVRKAIQQIIDSHNPYPAIAIDRHWNLVFSNQAFQNIIAGVDPEVLRPPLNILRVTMHPKGLASAIKNFADVSAHLLGRLAKEVETTQDPVMQKLYEECLSYPNATVKHDNTDFIILPIEIAVGDEVLSLISATTVFGTAREITVSELTLETFFPTDEKSSLMLHQLAATKIS